MKVSTRLLFATSLTTPVYLGLANSPLDNWFKSGAGWRAFEPLFRVCRAIGIRSDGDVLIGAMFAASFVIALVMLWIITRLVRQLMECL